MTNEEFIKLLEERGDTVYIVDRGLMRFGKFALALLAIFGLGVFFFGLDIKKAADEAKQARFDTEKTLAELTETKTKLITAKNDLDKSKAEFVKFMDTAKGELQLKLDEAAQASRRMTGYEQEAATVHFRLLQIGDTKAPSGIVAAAKSDPLRLATASPPGTTIKLALVSEVKELTHADLARVAASLQKQVVRDLKPIWGVDATVEPYMSLDGVPSDHWPIIVKKDAVPGGFGMHLDNGQPFAFVTYHADWTLTASHEMLGMLIDPLGDRFTPGPSPDPADNGKVVYFLVEICQPVQDKDHAYTIDGTMVSDFVTPAFYSVSKVLDTRLSFRGAAKSPFNVLKNGYMSCMVPETNEWHQVTWYVGEAPEYRDLGKIK
jgi:hypothetical protein